MNTTSAENLLLSEGQSAELQSCFQTIQEETADDLAKFKTSTCRQLGRVIVCRTYAPAIFELCQLVSAVAIVDKNRRYEFLFYGTGAARRSNFQSWFHCLTSVPREIQVDEKKILIKRGEKSFSITYDRMPFLSIMLEFMLTALGYAATDKLLAPIVVKFPDEQVISDTANSISRAIYAFLQDHLPKTQDQRRHRDFIEFVAKRFVEFPPENLINDQSVLEYWLSQGDGSENKLKGDKLTFRGIFKTAVRLIEILKLANDKNQISSALPVGTDYEAGEVDPTDVEALIFEIEEVSNPITGLADISRDGVKILNKIELYNLEQFLFSARVAKNLPRSIFRNIVFGDAQARISQGLRRNLTNREITLKIAEEPHSDYNEVTECLKNLIKHLDKMMLVIFHVLSQLQHKNAVNVALGINPDLDLSDFFDDTRTYGEKFGSENVTSLSERRVLIQFFDRVVKADPSDDLGALAVKAADAAEMISRRGFSEDDWREPSKMQLFADAVPLIVFARSELRKLLHGHILPINWEKLISKDTGCFRQQFLKLYGGSND